MYIYHYIFGNIGVFTFEHIIYDSADKKLTRHLAHNTIASCEEIGLLSISVNRTYMEYQPTLLILFSSIQY